MDAFQSVDIPAEVRAAYEAIFAQTPFVVSLGNARGMSGSQIFRLQTSAGEFCLRQWPAEHPNAKRLAAIHSAVAAVVEQGISYLAVPLSNSSGLSVTWVANRGWELSPWLPGTADYHANPTAGRLTAAVGSLAELHQVWRDQPWAGFDEPPQHIAPPPGLTKRLRWLRQLLTVDLQILGHLVERSPPTRLRSLALQVLANFPPLAERWQRDLALSADIAVPLQVCLRDVWHDHVLFTGDRVTGVIDYGAMNVDTPAADLARLLDSLVGDDESDWNIALESYAALHPLSKAERELCRAYQRSSILLTGMQWVTWLFREGRTFAPGQAELRLQTALSRMQGAIASETFLGG